MLFVPVLTVDASSVPAVRILSLTVMLLPVLMALLCGIAAHQQRSRPLRRVALYSLLGAFGAPMLAPGLSDPVRCGAAILTLLSTGLFWLAVCDMMGRPRHPAWLLGAPLAWLGLHLVLAAPGLPAGFRLADVLGFMAVDNAMALLCLPPLLLKRERSLSQDCLVAVVAAAVIMALPFAAGLVWSRPPFATAPGMAAVSLQMTRALLWPGLAILTATDMATRRERLLARQDDLSGLLNRRGFFRAVARMPDRTVLLFDIDHFKRINDTFGHAAGDAAIKRFALVLTELLGRDAILGRVGGEEFGAAIGAIEPGRALQTAEHVRAAFADAERAIGTGVTVSVGVAMAPRVPISVGEQMAAADRALYRAKKGGRNRVEVDPDPVRINVDAAS